MRGLSLTDGASAIAAMQSVNANIMTGWFALLFFGTPLATASPRSPPGSAAGASAAALAGGGRRAIYLVGCFAVTVVANVPMNDALAHARRARRLADAGAAWRDYAGPLDRLEPRAHRRLRRGFLCALLALWRWPG